MNAAKAALSRYGSRAIDGRSLLGLELKARREALVGHLGGPDVVSATERVVIERAIRRGLLVEHLERKLLDELPSLTAKDANGNLCVLPAVLDYARLADGEVRMMAQLGLQARKAPPKDIGTFMAEFEARAAATEPSEPPDEPSEPVILDVRADPEPEPPTKPKRTPVSITNDEPEP